MRGRKKKKEEEEKLTAQAGLAAGNGGVGAEAGAFRGISLVQLVVRNRCEEPETVLGEVPRRESTFA